MVKNPDRLIHFAYLFVALAVNLYAIFYQLRVIARPTQTYKSAASTSSGLPSLPQINAKFDLSSEGINKYPISTELASTAPWGSIVPPGNGGVYLPPSQEYHSLSEFQSAKSTLYQPSVWHGINCLHYIKRMYTEGDDGSGDTAHCLGFLRQSILCNPDLTLEDWEGSILGSDVMHTCKDLRELGHWQDGEYAKWSEDMKSKAEQL